MLVKTNETKVFRDCIHNYIHIDYEVIWDLIDTKEFQRLRRIHQLGGAYQVYHNAEHSRFSHSLGVYEIVRRMVYEIKDLNESLDEYEKITVMIAGLLHDIGHLPFSHGFENICPIKHEEFSTKIILGDSEVNKVLNSVDKDLAKNVASIIKYEHNNPILNQIVSGQLDADRMDYLLRDAYFTGTSYGEFDLERILRTIRVENNYLVVKESGIHSVEDYIMARYHMYWQVYYHPVCRSFERILESLFNRLKELYKNNPETLKDIDVFIPFLSNNPTIDDHFKLDENAAFYCISKLCNHKDKIVSDLSERIINRKLFEYTTITDQKIADKIKSKVIKKGYDPKYYYLTDKTTQSPYQPYLSNSGHNINVLKDNKTVKELSEVSTIVHSLVKGKVKEDKKVFYPKNI